VNVLFLQNTISELQGVMYLSRKLKDARHDVSVLITTRPAAVLRHIDDRRIDAICFSLMYGHQFWARDISRMIRNARPHVKILWGGIFPSFNSDYLLEVDSCVDMFCVGEAEDTIVSMIEASVGGSGFEGIRGAAYVKDGMLVQNKVCALTDVSELMPDRDLYFRASGVLRSNPTKIVVCSRGCIGDCSYCYNSRIKGLYRDVDPSPYVRQRSARALLDEISYIKKTYGMKRIFFYDDILVFNRQWGHEFLPAFRDRIGVPYMCYTRADLVTDEIVKLLKDTGCYMLSFGLESGNESLRTRVLNKRVSNEAIIKAAAIIKKHGLAFNTTNMVGFPGETYAMGLDTLELNIKIGSVGSCNILNPFPGTQLYEYCRENNLFDQQYFASERNQIHYYPMIKNPDRESLGNLERLFQLAVFFPKTMYPVVRRVARWRPNFFFDLIFVVMQFFYVRFYTERYGVRFMLKYYSEKFMAVFVHGAQ
jgi:radical SAM superfamily enzyme YgiQ (UPF0313 family)